MTFVMTLCIYTHKLKFATMRKGYIVEVYKWIVLALSISLDFWLRWLVYEA
jgi:hypothetical protein